MLKKLFVVLAVLLSFMLVGNAMAKPQPKNPPGYYEHTVTGAIKYFKNGHPDDPSQWVLVQPYDPPCFGSCEDAVALAEGGVMIVSPFEVVDDKGMGWGAAGGKNLTLEARALATGKDQRFFCFKIPGFAWADVDLNLVMSVYTRVFTTGEQWYTGLPSITYAKAVGTLSFEADAIAMGNKGCPQFADTSLKGIMTTTAGAYSLAVGPNGSYSYTRGEGTTAVRLRASDSDFDKFGWWIFPPVAHAGIEGFVLVKQGAFTKAWVSKDGMTTFNFGMVTGGSAIAFGDVDILGIRAKGSVMQESMAADGMGAYAYGNSSASFQGAKGQVYNGRCGSFANVGGIAMVMGYNNISHSGNSVSITSKHSAFATTGNGGYQGPSVGQEVVY